MYKPQKYTNTDSTDCRIMTKLTRADNDGMGIYVALLFIPFRNTNVTQSRGSSVTLVCYYPCKDIIVTYFIFLNLKVMYRYNTLSLH